MVISEMLGMGYFYVDFIAFQLLDFGSVETQMAWL